MKGVIADFMSRGNQARQGSMILLEGGILTDDEEGQLEFTSLQ